MRIPDDGMLLLGMRWNTETRVLSALRIGIRVEKKKAVAAPDPEETMEWDDLRTLLLRVLDRFPDAKQAVLNALKET